MHNSSFDNDLFIPQRQAPAGILIEFIFTLGQTLKAAWPLAIYLILSVNKEEKLQINAWVSGLLLFLLLIGMLIYSWLRYRNFQFYIDPEQQLFILQHGIWNKKKTLIQLHKIQQVHTSQHVFQQLLDVHSLEIETAGSFKPEIRIKAVKQDTAEALKTYLMTLPGASTSEKGDPGDSPALPILAIPLRRLFLFGISANYMESFFVLLGFFLTLYDDLNNFFSEAQTRSRMREFADPPATILAYVLLAVGLLLLVFLFNLIRSVLPYYNYRIFRKEKGLLLKYGLLKQKNLLLYSQKIKLVRLSQNPIQRIWNLFGLNVHQSLSPEQQQRQSTIVIPGCTGEESGELMKIFFDGQPLKGQTFKPDIRKLIPLTLFGILLPFLLFTYLYFSTFLPAWLWVLMFLYLLLASRMIYLSYKNNALFVHPEFILHQSGAWTKKLTILRPNRIQSITTRQAVWHRKAGIGHLLLSTAGGTIHFRYGSFSQIKTLSDFWLYQVESDPERPEI